MAFVQALRVKNLRSLKDSGFISLKPITVLVGKNSAGKSTFARVFPLLRQSAEESKRTPLLWYGRLVDFGSIADAIGSSGSHIEFGFRVTFVYDPEGLDLFHDVDDIRAKEHPAEVLIQVAPQADKEATRLTSVTISIYENRCELTFGQNGVTSIKVGDYKWAPSATERQLVSYRSLLPRLRFLKERRATTDVTQPKTLEAYEPLKEDLVSEIRRYVHGNASQETLENIAGQINIAGDDELRDKIRAASGVPSWKSNIESLSQSGFRRLRDRIFAASLPSLLEAIDERLVAYFAGVRYLEPLRATALRYYRRQELAIDEVDSKGSNVPFFLDSLSVTERRDFEEWMEKHFQVSVFAHSEAGHITLRMKESPNSAPRNLADTGFGFSQLLPIASQLWAVTRSSRGAIRIRRRMPTCIVIEQPELHLHPEYQARLSDVIVSCFGGVKSKIDSRLAFVIETHSPSLINRLGQLVLAGQIAPEHIQVVLFEKESGDAPTTVKVVTFDQDGVLQDWPFGFFEPTLR
jgi:hypothetical protein